MGLGIHSNPIAAMILGQPDLNEEQGPRSAGAGGQVRERAGGSGPASLTNPVNIGIGTK